MSDPPLLTPSYFSLTTTNSTVARRGSDSQLLVSNASVLLEFDPLVPLSLEPVPSTLENDPFSVPPSIESESSDEYSLPILLRPRPINTIPESDESRRSTDRTSVSPVPPSAPGSAPNFNSSVAAATVSDDMRPTADAHGLLLTATTSSVVSARAPRPPPPPTGPKPVVPSTTATAQERRPSLTHNKPAVPLPPRPSSALPKAPAHFAVAPPGLLHRSRANAPPPPPLPSASASFSVSSSTSPLSERRSQSASTLQQLPKVAPGAEAQFATSSATSFSLVRGGSLRLPPPAPIQNQWPPMSRALPYVPLSKASAPYQTPPSRQPFQISSSEPESNVRPAQMAATSQESACAAACAPQLPAKTGALSGATAGARSGSTTTENEYTDWDSAPAAKSDHQQSHTTPPKPPGGKWPPPNYQVPPSRPAAAAVPGTVPARPAPQPPASPLPLPPVPSSWPPPVPPHQGAHAPAPVQSSNLLFQFPTRLASTSTPAPVTGPIAVLLTPPPAPDAGSAPATNDAPAPLAHPQNDEPPPPLPQRTIPPPPPLPPRIVPLSSAALPLPNNSVQPAPQAHPIGPPQLPESAPPDEEDVEVLFTELAEGRRERARRGSDSSGSELSVDGLNSSAHAPDARSLGTALCCTLFCTECTLISYE